MPTADPAIQLDRVSRHYAMGESSVRAVNELSLSVANNEFLALLGSSGSGKSTLLNLIAGLDRPTSGTILAHGRNIASLSSLDLARYRCNTIGMIFQSFNLLPRMTLEENIELPLRRRTATRRHRARPCQSPEDSSRRRAHRQSRFRHRRSHPHPSPRTPVAARHDHRHGHPRTPARRSLRRPSRHHGRRQAPLHHFRERRSAMKPRDLADLALRNLRESILRHALTTLGVAVGVASLVAMLSLGVGLQQLAAKRLSQSGLFDTIIVTPKNAFRGIGRPHH